MAPWDPAGWPEWRNWQTRRTQNAVPHGVWVQVPLRAPLASILANKGIGAYSFRVLPIRHLLAASLRAHPRGGVHGRHPLGLPLGRAQKRNGDRVPVAFTGPPCGERLVALGGWRNQLPSPPVHQPTQPLDVSRPRCHARSWYARKPMAPPTAPRWSPQTTRHGSMPGSPTRASRTWGTTGGQNTPGCPAGSGLT